MKRLALLAIPLFCLTTPASSADLDSPQYRERDTYYDRPAPRVVERERIIERRYYEPEPVYREERVYIEPRVYYAPRVHAEAYYHRPYAYAYSDWRPRHYFPRRHWHHHHHHHGYHHYRGHHGYHRGW
jgi:hypothetical protein